MTERDTKMPFRIVQGGSDGTRVRRPREATKEKGRGEGKQPVTAESCSSLPTKRPVCSV